LPDGLKHYLIGKLIRVAGTLFIRHNPILAAVQEPSSTTIFKLTHYRQITRFQGS
jgi:hypothetical protein